MYITLRFKLIENSKEDLEILKNLMKLQSSAVRYAYNRIREGYADKDIYHLIREKFPSLPTRYITHAINKAKSINKDHEQIVFGGKKIFEKLCKNHLQGKRREKLKEQWRQNRKYNLISIGTANNTDKGNRLLRFEKKNDELYLRVNIQPRKWIWLKVKRQISSKNDKWAVFTAMLDDLWKNKRYFPYTVELKIRGNDIYGYVTFDFPVPSTYITKNNGVIGIDTNASPLHLALAEISKDGNLISYERHKLHKFLLYEKNRREYEEWILAHEIVNLAIEKQKAIAIENLNKVNKGYRGDGKAKLRKRLTKWNYKSLLSKIESIAIQKGVEIIKVNPAYTSVIGGLKYAPILNIDKDIAGAYVIARRAMGFKERIPVNYRKLLEDKEYINYAIEKLNNKIQELKESINQEKNKYKQKPLKQELRKIIGDIKSIQSFQSESSFCKGANGRNLEQTNKAWQVLRVALVIPILGKPFNREYSSLKTILVSGNVERVASRLVPH
jgi:transposase, IS605 OrfB family, central region